MLYIVPSIDVEAAHGDKPFEQMILGEIDKKESFGVFKIAEILSKYLSSGTFFIDVYEYKLWGENKFKKLVLDLLSLNQDVQLHTHPSWRWDNRDTNSLNNHKRKNSFLVSEKDLMTKLSFDEQKYVISHGIEKLLEWTGLDVISHRSGGYSVNQNTIKALSSLGIKIDSSINTCHSNTKIDYKYVNKPSIINNVMEFPITATRATLGRYPPLNLIKRNVKTDIGNINSDLMISWAQQALDNNVRYMSYFMHSYSLLNFDKNFKTFSQNIIATEELIKFLDWCSSQDKVKVVTYKWLLDNKDQLNYCLNGSDFVPKVVISSNRVIKYALDRFLS